MPHQLPDIVMDAERMKSPHTGLYHFCLHLGMALQQQQSQHKAVLGFYLPPNAQDAFAGAPNLRQSGMHKVGMPFAGRLKLWHCTNQLSSYFPRSKKVKKVLTIHDLNFLYEKSKAKKKKYLDKVQKKMDKADAIVAISSFVKNEIEENLNTHQKKVQVIYNGCNINDTIKPEKPAIAIPAPFIFSIGTIMPKKNFHVLPAAVVNNHYHLVLAGAVHNKLYLKKIMAEAAGLGVADKVHFIDTVSEAEKYWLLQHCSLFAFPSLAEGFGLPVIEAMHFGKPVLLSKATSLPEVGGPLANYLDSFEPNHIAAMAVNAIKLHNEEKAKHLAEWANTFSWHKAAAEYWKLYDSLVK